MKRNDLVSIIIPTYKGWSNLSRAIESCCKQTYSNIELIIVDDNDKSTSREDYLKTKKIVEYYINAYSNKLIKYIEHKKNKGGSAARNTGILASEGTYICFLDDDDIYLNDRIEKSVFALESENSAGGVVCQVFTVNQNSNSLQVLTSMDDTNDLNEKLLLNTMYIGTGSNLFMRRKYMYEIGFFDESFIRFQDIEYMIKFSQKIPVILLDEYLIIKATNDNNNLPDFFKLRDSWERLLEEASETIKSIQKKDKYDLFLKQRANIFRYSLAKLSWKEINENHFYCNKKPYSIYLLKIRLYYSQKNIYKILKKIYWQSKSKAQQKDGKLSRALLEYTYLNDINYERVVDILDNNI